MADAPNTPPYRREAFTHWANLAALAGGALLGAVHDPLWWVATAGLQVGVLWVLPDLPFWKAAINEKHKASRLLAERAYYLKELWGLEAEPAPQGGFFKRLFVESVEPDLDSRIVNRHDPSCRDYLEMRQIVQKLRELRAVPGVQVSAYDIERLDVIVNGYLRLLFATRPLQAAIARLEMPVLRREVQQLSAELERADPAVRPAIAERIRIAEAQLERRPKLEAMLHLYRSRISDMVHQIRNLQGQVLANPTSDVHAMLDEMARAQEMVADPFGHLTADQLIRELSAPPRSRAGREAEDDDDRRAGRASRGTLIQ